jgi:cobaltochelatase CobS
MQAECTKVNGSEHAEVFRLLAHAVEEHIAPKPTVDEEKVRSICDERIAQARLPRPVEVKLDSQAPKVLDGRQHCQFESLLELVAEGHRNILLTGPAGSGKTTLAGSLAQALDLPFGFISLSAGVTETHLLGRTLPQTDGSWKFIASRLVEVYEQGGVFLLDEFDAADANLMVAINAALANGVLVTMDGTLHHRHAKCYILAAANTWGRGGDTQYVGRNQLDAATLDRFILSTLHIDYDRELERDLAAGLPDEQAAELIQWVENLRNRIRQNRLRRIASTRLVVNATVALKAGRTLDAVQDRFYQDWSADEKAKVQL